jgi:hypothetical protein
MKMTLGVSDFTMREMVAPRLPETVRTQWLTIDNVFVECLTVRSSESKVAFPPGKGNATFEGWIERLFLNSFGKKMLGAGPIMRTYAYVGRCTHFLFRSSPQP